MGDKGLTSTQLMRNPNLLIERLLILSNKYSDGDLAYVFGKNSIEQLARDIDYDGQSFTQEDLTDRVEQVLDEIMTLDFSKKTVKQVGKKIFKYWKDEIGDIGLLRRLLALQMANRSAHEDEAKWLKKGKKPPTEDDITRRFRIWENWMNMDRKEYESFFTSLVKCFAYLNFTNKDLK